MKRLERADEFRHLAHTLTLRRLKLLQMSQTTCRRCHVRRATCLRGDEEICGVCAARTPLDRRRALLAETKRRA